jgi:hypothetical protein
MNTAEEIKTIVDLAWDTTIDDSIRDSMLSHFEFMDEADWVQVKSYIVCSESVQRIIDTIDTLREMH